MQLLFLDVMLCVLGSGRSRGTAHHPSPDRCPCRPGVVHCTPQAWREVDSGAMLHARHMCCDEMRVACTMHTSTSAALHQVPCSMLCMFTEGNRTRINLGCTGV
jgi:hypothetical protein